MNGQHVRHIHIMMGSPAQKALEAIQGEKLESLGIDELVGSVAVIDLVTSHHRIRIKNLQYEQPLKEDGRDYPCLSAEEAGKAIEECRTVLVGNIITAVEIVRDRAVWNYEDKQWDILCDTGICITLQNRMLLIHALDSDEGALAWKFQKENTDGIIDPFDWGGKTKSLISTGRERIRLTHEKI